MADKKLNPFTYSQDPELHQVFNSMVDLQARVKAQFEKAERLAGFANDLKFMPLVNVELALPNYRTLREVEDRWIKKIVPMSVVESQVRDAISVAEAKLKEAELANVPAVVHNQDLRTKIGELMQRLGIGSSYTTMEYATSRSRTKRTEVHTAGYVGDLSRASPTSNITSESYRLRTYISDFERWKAEVLAKEKADAITKDEETVKTKVMGNPALVAKVYEAGVNILDELSKAVPGEKAEVIKYCLAKAIANEKAKVEPSSDAIKQLEVFLSRV